MKHPTLGRNDKEMTELIQTVATVLESDPPNKAANSTGYITYQNHDGRTVTRTLLKNINVLTRVLSSYITRFSINF